MTADEQEALRLLRNMPDWYVPIWFRAGIRLMNNVPHARVRQLALQECAAAEAKQQKMEGP